MKQFREGGFLVARIHTLCERVLAKILKRYDLDEINPAQGRIFFALWQKDGVPIAELSKRTSLEKSTLTSMLDRLENGGYVARVPSKEDRRKILIELTEKDRKLEGVYTKICKEKIVQFYKGFSEKEIETFEGFLWRILHNLESFEKTYKNDGRGGG